ncbi:MAG: TrkH family potassium uptake protein [Bacteroidales bacterium]|jgi:trk system potassium uptake protein TrkH|nr:TrkH family potassium uptake protein [Bacteroidales bacterium]
MTESRKENIKRWLTVFHVIGALLIIESLFMFLSLIPSFIYGGSDALIIIKCGIITLVCGLLLYLTQRTKDIIIDRRQGYIIVALIWVVMSICGALPYYIGHYVSSFTDAYYETMSGFTTTGGTIITNVESIPKGILFWRGLTHWIGGIGIIVIILSFIPFVGGGGMALFSAEVAGPSKDKISPKTKQTSKILLMVYSSLTILYLLTYWILGMNFFDAICHAFATIATGGFSTKNYSAAAFSPAIQYAMIIFMTLSGTNLLLIYYSYKKKFSKLKQNEEFRVYLGVIIITLLIVFFWTTNIGSNIEETFRNALFQVLSILTTTGFVSCDYNQWPTPAIVALIIIMWSGAMSGSTTGGLKIVRIILLFKNAKNIITKGIHSNAFIPVKLDNKVVSDDVIYNVLAVFILYVIVVVISILILVSTNISLEESIVTTLSSITNIGPGFGKSGGFGNYEYFSDLAKWDLTAIMYIGRLEIMTVFVIFTPSFWKR